MEKFARDPKTGKLLWFSGPPIRPTPPSAYGPRHSLAYLAFLARGGRDSKDTSDDQNKRRKVDEDEAIDVDVDANGTETSTLPNPRQLLEQWRIRPDGSLELQSDDGDEAHPEALTEDVNELLATAMNGMSTAKRFISFNHRLIRVFCQALLIPLSQAIDVYHSAFETKCHPITLFCYPYTILFMYNLASNSCA